MANLTVIFSNRLTKKLMKKVRNIQQRMIDNDAARKVSHLYLASSQLDLGKQPCTSLKLSLYVKAKLRLLSFC